MVTQWNESSAGSRFHYKAKRPNGNGKGPNGKVIIKGSM